jgi:hypothetical protein
MYVQKSFIINTTFANNTPGVVAKLGELSSNSLTFSREKGYYSNKITAPNLLLTTFISKDGNNAIPIPTLISQQTLDVCNFIYNQTLGGQVDILPSVLLENLLTNFVDKAGEFVCGNMVSDGIHTLPEWVSWKCLTDNNYAENFIKVWFVDASFQQQYDEYEIYVVPPFDTLDNFFKPGDEVEGIVGLLTSSAMMDRIQLAKEEYPNTVTRINTYNYVDPLNANHTIKTDWGVLIYGPSGDNVDSIKDAIMTYIMANTTHTREEWIKIFPDIFKRTEFILLPLWDQFAIPNRELTTGIYSPQIQYSEIAAKMKQYATQYPSAHIDSNMTMMGHPYRSLAILAIGSPDNRDGKYKLNELFADLIAVTSTSVDFNRMSKNTQDWAFMIEQMLYAAESMSDFTTIPVGMMKVHRDGILYLTKSYNNVNYLVVAKSNMG